MASFQHDAPTTPLRQRMQEDMVMRGLGSHTRQDYIRHVRRFATFLGRAPDTAMVEDIRRFQLHQHDNGVGPATINSTVSALRFLFTVTLKRRDLARALVITRNPRKLPDVLSIEEAARLLEAAPGIKYKAALGVAYGAGLRVSEFIRRFLLHVLPRGFHRIRHYGLLAGSSRKTSIASARELLNAVPPPPDEGDDEPIDIRPPCPCCGGRMIVIEVFKRWRQPRGPPDQATRNRENTS
ncbi:hypothetical protein GFL49_14435 [Rhizobium leguminosarum bv. viciae]|nr:hypothetical protein [Rhizobium leguminosarum bv. viciae]